jgi:hypothetical protein
VFITLACIFGVTVKRQYKRFMDYQEVNANRDPVESLGKSARASSSMQPDFSNLLLYGGVFVLSVVGGGLLFAHDVSTYLGNKALKIAYDDSEGSRSGL